jgi:hypothetical protein
MEHRPLGALTATLSAAGMAVRIPGYRGSGTCRELTIRQCCLTTFALRFRRAAVALAYQALSPSHGASRRQVRSASVRPRASTAARSQVLWT